MWRRRIRLRVAVLVLSAHGAGVGTSAEHQHTAFECVNAKCGWDSTCAPKHRGLSSGHRPLYRFARPLV